MWELQDYNEITRLKAVSNPSKTDMDSCFNLYKKYLDNNIQSYRTDCTCSGSITSIFSLLTQWFELNKVGFKKEGE